MQDSDDPIVILTELKRNFSQADATDVVAKLDKVLASITSDGDRLDKIRQDREKFYGNPTYNMDTTAAMLTGLLENHFQMKLPHVIPGHIWALALVAMKLNRAAFALNEDNYDDAINYLRIAAERQRAQKAQDSSNRGGN